MLLRVTALGFFLAILVAAPVLARRFDVNSYVKEALASSHEVREKAESLEIQKDEYVSALAGMYLPHIYYTLSDIPYSESRTAFAVKKKEMSSDLSLTYNLFNNFSDKVSLEISKINRTRAGRALWLKKQEITLKAVKKYCEVLKAKRLMGVVKANEASYADEYQKALQYYKEGFKSYSDLLKSDLNLKTAQLSALSSENYYRNSLMDLNYAVYADPQEENLLAELDFDTSLRILPVEESLVTAMGRRQEILLYEENIRIRELEKNRRLKGYLPQLSADLAWSRSELFGLGDVTGRSDAYYLKFSLTMPLGSDLFDRNKDYMSSKIYLEREKRALSELRLSIKKEIISVSLEFFYAKKKYEVSSVKADISRNNLEIIKQKYSEGKASILDLIEAQKDDLSSQSDLAESYYDLYIKAADYGAAVGKQLWSEEKK